MNRVHQCPDDCDKVDIDYKPDETCVKKNHVEKKPDESDREDNENCSNLNDDGIHTEEISGYKDVESMMKTWNEMPELRDWQFKIEFVEDMNGDPTKYCTFEVKWTKPMAGFTYPTITVNVYVFVKIVEPQNPDSLNDVKYVFEGDRFAHDARLQFNPKWLYHAYEDKKSSIKLLKL
ncbi:hypothetical protein QAD02_006842 [Eretmocerus hayati]|uniref:Uncharacterized protein n=1 Tax=Eretmocerus hayati TaxID=131215 RepID=A0ACC2N215_9HYME|nr:hypothetical protein QAD02_006842 [Eretmocerus hayati]